MIRTALAAALLVVAAATSARPHEWAQPIERPELPNLHRVSATTYPSAQPRDGAQDALSALGFQRLLSRP